MARLRDELKVPTKAKSLSPNDRICDRIAFADGVFETGLPMSPAEKRSLELACEVEWGTFSSPV